MAPFFNKLALIMGNQLFADVRALQPDDNTLFFMAEDEGLCRRYTYHKFKLILILSAMRSFRDHLETRYHVAYWKLDGQGREKSYEEKLFQTLKHAGINKIVTYHIEDKPVRSLLDSFCQENRIRIDYVPSPKFLTSSDDFHSYFEGKNRPRMQHFYKWQRKRLGILVKNDKPIGGKWSFDAENRKPLPKNINIPDLPVIQSTRHTKVVAQLVERMFPAHPGQANRFYLATTHNQAQKWLDDFLEKRFRNFGPYEDTVDSTRPFLFHSLLSPYLNIGLLTPQQILDKTISWAEKNDVHFSSVEGFVRQIIGWREFIRAMYDSRDFNQNYFHHQRKLTSIWYDGTTGIEPLDTVIQRVMTFGYLHHIERLMIVGNLMLLSEIHPDEVYRWFMELFIDSANWVMAPNVYGMSQFADGGSFATKPYIAGSNYVLKMSNYKKGTWCETMDGLYWRFIDKHRQIFENNPRMRMMTKSFDRMAQERKKRILKAAEYFIENMTTK